MSSQYLDDPVQSFPPVALEDASFSGESSIAQPTVEQLLERISDLEEETANLRKLEETIHVNNHFFETLLRAGNEAVLLLNPSLTIVRLVHSILGYSEREVLGQSMMAFTHPEDAPQLEHCCARILSGEIKNCVNHTRFLTPQGEWIWVEAQITDLLDDPHVQALLVKTRRSATRPAQPPQSGA